MPTLETIRPLCLAQFRFATIRAYPKIFFSSPDAVLTLCRRLLYGKFCAVFLMHVMQVMQDRDVAIILGNVAKMAAARNGDQLLQILYHLYIKHLPQMTGYGSELPSMSDCEATMWAVGGLKQITRQSARRRR
jgi:hypothetical protein